MTKKEKESICKVKKMGLQEYDVFQDRWNKAVDRIKRASIKRNINLAKIPIIYKLEESGRG